MKPKRKYLQIERSRHGKMHFYVRKRHGHRIRLPASYGSREFWAAYKVAVAADVQLYRPPAKQEIQKQKIETAIRRGLAAAKQRSRNKSLAFDLTMDWAREQIERQQFCCSLTGIPFFESPKRASKCEPFVPSFDRLNNAGGYTRDNVRIVIFALNAMLLDWGQGVFERVVNKYRFHKSSISSPALFSRCGPPSEKGQQ